MPNPRFPWPMGDRQGGPLLGPKLLDPTITFTWDTENGQALPGGTTFTRASVKQEFDGTVYFELSSGAIPDNSAAVVSGPKGFNPEPAATNQMPSVQFSTPDWASSGIQSKSDNGINSLGLQEASVITSAATTEHSLRANSASGSSGSAYFIMEAGTLSQFYNLVRGTGANDYVTFDLINGTVTEEGAGTQGALVTDLGNGRYKTHVYTNDVGVLLKMAFSDSGTPGTATPSFGGVNAQLLPCHAQYENTVFATSPMVPIGSPKSRAADILDVGVAITTEFSALLDITLPDIIGTGNTITLLGASSTAQDILFVNANFQVLMSDGGSAITVGAASSKQRIKISYGRDATGRSASLDGATAVTGGAPSPSHVGENFELGSKAGINQSRCIHHLTTLYDERKSDAELEALSA